MSFSRKLLRWLAILGPCIALLQEVVISFPWKERQEWGLPLLVVLILAVAFTLRFLMPAATCKLLRQPDLLIPVGLLFLAQGVLDWSKWLPPLAALLMPTQPVKIWSLTFSLSVSVVAGILIRVTYATWMTLLIVEAHHQERAEPEEALRRLPHWFLRVLLLEVVGWGVLLVTVALALSLMAAGLPLALFLAGVASLLWNLATAALLPVALNDRLSFREALSRGIQASWAGKSRWWPAVVAQLLLLGWLTFISVSYTIGPRYHAYQNTDWSVNGFWIGGYADESRWYGKLMEALDAPKVPLISTLLEMVLGLLAIAVKVHIADRLNGLEGRIRKLPPEGTPASSSDWPSGFDQGVTDVSRSSPPPSANAAAEIYRSGEGEYMKKVFRIFLAVTILLGVIPALGVEHKQGMASQHLNQYWAVREINTWFLFGVEIYANNRLAVYDMMDRTRDDLPIH